MNLIDFILQCAQLDTLMVFIHAIGDALALFVMAAVGLFLMAVSAAGTVGGLFVLTITCCFLITAAYGVVFIMDCFMQTIPD